MNAFPMHPTLRPLLRFFGSLELAMVLMAIVILACIVGTLVESRLDTDVARAYVYDAPWFIAWLSLLCVNLIGAVLVRGSLKSHHAGFAITHAGVVILLLGAIVGRIWGVDGMVTLFKGEPPVDHLAINEKLIEVSRGTENQMRAVNPKLHPPSPLRPLVLQLKDVRVSAIGYSPRLGRRTVVEAGADEGSPALHLVLSRATASRPIEHWLVLGDSHRDRLDLGTALIRLLPGALPVPSAKSAPAPRKTGEEACREVHFLFAKMPEMAVVRALDGSPTGARAVYRFGDGAGQDPKTAATVAIDVDDRHFELAVDRCLGKAFPLEGTPWTVTILKTFADFRMQGKEPVSVSDQPNNPALMLEITGRSSRKGPAPAAGRPGMPHGHPAVDGHASADGRPQPSERLLIYRAPDGKLSFETQSTTRGIARGTLAIGKALSTGWGDWKLVIDRAFPHARVHEELAPMDEGGSPPLDTEGVQLRVESGGQSATRWVGFGEGVDFNLGGPPVHAAFGQRLHPLGFGVALDEFEVERDEGTMNPAGFKSHIRFTDPTGKGAVPRTVWMNHPADFPDFPGVSLFGTAFKFSQASWDPENLNQTTLQVVRDPGWPLKWIGSLMVCLGLFATFYLRPDSQRAGPTNATEP